MMRIKYWILTAAAQTAVLVALLGIRPTSWGWLYQPEVPEELQR